jgi:prefoldin alpha subunit
VAKLADPVTSLLVEVQYLENLAQSLQQRISYVEAAVAELQVAMSTVRNLGNEATGAEVLVPIGGGSYVRAKVADVEKLIVGIGADVAVEKNFKESVEGYQARIEELRKVGVSLGQELERVAVSIGKARQELQRLSKKTPEGT